MKKKIVAVLLLLIFCLNVLISQNRGPSFEGEWGEDRTQRIEDFEKSKPSIIEERINEEEYIVGPGDVFGINISSSRNMSFTSRINPTGEVIVPTVGTIDLGEVNLKKARKEIKKKIRKQYKNSEIYVVLFNIRKFKIQVTGAVKKPGLYTITPITRLDEIIERAGGFRQLAKEYNIQVTNKNEQDRKVNYFKYLLDGNKKHNPTFIEGHKIEVPFGNFKENGVLLKGLISGQGYDLIKEDETLQHYLLRTGEINKDANLDNIKIKRSEGDVLRVNSKEFKKTKLKPGDRIYIIKSEGVAVNGFVQSPGIIKYAPGYTAEYYVQRAGGPKTNGDINRIVVKHPNGNIKQGKDTIINRGDVIIVPRTIKHWLFGEASILSIITSIASITLSYIAATN